MIKKFYGSWIIERKFCHCDGEMISKVHRESLTLDAFEEYYEEIKYIRIWDHSPCFSHDIILTCKICNQVELSPFHYPRLVFKQKNRFMNFISRFLNQINFLKT